MKLFAILLITLVTLIHAHPHGEPVETSEVCEPGTYDVEITRRGAGQRSMCKPGKRGLAIFIDVDDGCDHMKFKATVCRPKNIRKRSRKIIFCVRRKLKKCSGKPVAECALRFIQSCSHPKRLVEVIG